MKDRELRKAISLDGNGKFDSSYNIPRRNMTDIKRMQDEIYLLRKHVTLLTDKIGYEFRYQNSYPDVELIEVPKNYPEKYPDKDVEEACPHFIYPHFVCPYEGSLKEEVVVTPNPSRKEHP